MGAEVEDDRMTWRKGCSNEGISKLLMSISRVSSAAQDTWSDVVQPVHPLRSPRSRANADMRGLSCKLFPLLPRSPQRLAEASSSSLVAVVSFPSFPLAPFESLCNPLSFWGVLDRRSPCRYDEDNPPPKMAVTDACAHLACFLIADVTVMHSVLIKATGSIAIDIAVHVGLEACMLASRWPSWTT